MRDVEAAEADLPLRPAVRRGDFGRFWRAVSRGRDRVVDPKPEIMLTPDALQAIDFVDERALAAHVVNRRHHRPREPLQAIPVLARVELPIEVPDVHLIPPLDLARDVQGEVAFERRAVPKPDRGMVLGHAEPVDVVLVVRRGPQHGAEQHRGLARALGLRTC